MTNHYLIDDHKITLTKSQEEIDLDPKYCGPRLHILLEPEHKHFSLPRVKTVRQLLHALKLKEERALVARDGQLLTPDRSLGADESILVWQVGSRG
ncbi:MAG: hypothetical protein IJS50_04700 [Desulfovibrio sp.]|nr:hypothetical protein [Desulfovibrio sp.]